MRCGCPPDASRSGEGQNKNAGSGPAAGVVSHRPIIPQTVRACQAKSTLGRAVVLRGDRTKRWATYRRRRYFEADRGGVASVANDRRTETVKRILVVGGTGTVGRQVVLQLAGSGVDVRAMTRNSGAAGFPEGVEVKRGDLTDPASLDPCL